MKSLNEMKLIIDSKSINEGYSRVAVGAFVASVDPNLEELTDIKTAVSDRPHENGFGHTAGDIVHL